MSKLTARDMQTIRSALNRAIVERESFAASYGEKGPEQRGALDLVARYEKLHIKLFGTPSGPAQDKAMYAAMDRVSIFDLVEQKAAKP